MNKEEALEKLTQKFTSDNSMPVDMARITREEFEALQEDKWISVEDELPIEAELRGKSENKGWLIFDGKIVTVTFLHPSYWKESDGYEDPRITHWQNLPNPPITKKRGGCNP